MPKYLIHGSYTIEGVRGFLMEGGSVRQKQFRENIENVGGKVESYYFAFGGDDVYGVVDLPDNVSAAAMSLALNAGGGFHATVVALLTPEEIDLATEKAPAVRHRPPGR